MSLKQIGVKGVKFILSENFFTEFHNLRCHNETKFPVFSLRRCDATKVLSISRDYLKFVRDKSKIEGSNLLIMFIEN